MANVLTSLWDVVSYNHVLASDKPIHRVNVWLWDLGMDFNCYIRWWDWGGKMGAYEVRAIDPQTGLGGTVCLLAAGRKRQKGLGHMKADLKKWFAEFPKTISDSGIGYDKEFASWTEYVNFCYIEWMKDPH